MKLSHLLLFVVELAAFVVAQEVDPIEPVDPDPDPHPYYPNGGYGTRLEGSCKFCSID